MTEEVNDVVESIASKYGVDLKETVNEMMGQKQVECNQCHSNCNDCGYDR